MVRSTVFLVLWFFTCVYASPVPDKAKVVLIRDSIIGVALAAGESKTAGIFHGDNVHAEVEKEEGEKRPDFSLIEKVNFGAAFAIDKSISVGVFKDNIFKGKNPFQDININFGG